MSRRALRCVAAVLLAMAAGGGRSARAEFLVGNLDQSTFGSQDAANLTIAGRFTLDPAPTNYALSSVTLRLDGSGSPIDSPVRLFADGVAGPGALIATLGTVQAAASSGDALYDVSVDPNQAGVLLVAGRSYWLGIGVADLPTTWAYTLAVESNPLGLIDDELVIFAPGQPPTVTGSAALQFAVNATILPGAAVPEPSSLATCAIGLAAFLGRCAIGRRRGVGIDQG